MRHCNFINNYTVDKWWIVRVIIRSQWLPRFSRANFCYFMYCWNSTFPLVRLYMVHEWFVITRQLCNLNDFFSFVRKICCELIRKSPFNFIFPFNVFFLCVLLGLKRQKGTIFSCFYIALLSPSSCEITPIVWAFLELPQVRSCDEDKCCVFHYTFLIKLVNSSFSIIKIMK